MGLSRQEIVQEILHRHLTEGETPTITASEVARCVASPFALYCDWFAPENERDEDSELLRIRREHGLAHELDMIEGEVISIPVRDTLEENFRLTVEMMADGVLGMYNMLLMSNPAGMVGAPDQLLKVDGSKSIFGDYSYRVVEVKSNLNLTSSHRIQAAFYNRLLGLIQGSTPQTFTMIDGAGANRLRMFPTGNATSASTWSALGQLHWEKCLNLSTDRLLHHGDHSGTELHKETLLDCIRLGIPVDRHLSKQATTQSLMWLTQVQVVSQRSSE